MNPRAVYHENGDLYLLTPFRRRYVEALKHAIPSECREYDPEARCWIVWGGCQSLALQLFERSFPEGHIERPSTASPTTSALTSPWRMLYVNEDAPRVVVDAAFKALAKANHPDRGGDVVAMQALNAAYAELTSGGAR